MRVALLRLGGLERVTVSFGNGVAEVKLKPGNTVTIEQIRNAIRARGFQPRGAEVRAVGSVADRNGIRVLAVSGLGVAYPLVEDPKAKRALRDLLSLGEDREVVVTGFLGADAESGVPSLQVRGFSVIGPSTGTASAFGGRTIPRTRTSPARFGTGAWPRTQPAGSPPPETNGSRPTAPEG